MKIAIVGLSDKPDRPSYQVAEYLLKNGFEIVPVNPLVETVIGLKSFDSISEVLSFMDVDVVDIFRRPEEVLPIVEEVIASGKKPLIWMQEGVISPEGKQVAEAHGMKVIMNACMMKSMKAKAFQAMLKSL
jgi:uncharacterized protein